MKIKTERLNHTIQIELSIIIMREVKNELVKSISITGVETTNDLSYSKVYYIIRDIDKRKQVEEALEKTSSFIRTKLAEKINIRTTPKLVFQYDTSIEYGEHIEKIMSEIKEKENQ